MGGIAKLAEDGEALRGRMMSLDVLRGLSIAGMILVTDPGTYSAVYPQLLHASWTGATATDMIFPCFLFAAGVAIPLAAGARMERGATRRGLMLQAARRCVLLILLGLLLNAFPEFRWATLRLPGVLQRIGVCTLAGSALFLGTLRMRLRTRVVWLVCAMVGLLVLYAVLLLLVPVPAFGAGHLDTLRSLPAYVDRTVFTVAHLWPYGVTPGMGVTFDPEGLLSTLPALVNLLIGVLVGQAVMAEGRPGLHGVVWMAGGGAALLLAGLLLGLAPWMPLIKKLWTPSFALVSAGVSLLGFAMIYFVIDLRGMRRGWTPLLVLGTNAIGAFTVSGLLTSTLNLLRTSAGDNWHAWAYTHLFLPWLPAKMASLLYAIAIVALNCGLIGLLYRRRIFLRL